MYVYVYMYDCVCVWMWLFGISVIADACVCICATLCGNVFSVVVIELIVASSCFAFYVLQHYHSSDEFRSYVSFVSFRLIILFIYIHSLNYWLLVFLCVFINTFYSKCVISKQIRDWPFLKYIFGNTISIFTYPIAWIWWRHSLIQVAIGMGLQTTRSPGGVQSFH